MKQKFLLDENILHFAIHGVDQHEKPDPTSTKLVLLIGLNCHSIAVNKFLLDRYWHQIGKIQREGRRPKALQPVRFIRELLTNSQKWALDSNECPELPAGVVVPRKDIEIVRFALLTQTRIVTGDDDLREAVNNSRALNLQALTPAEALRFAADT